MSVLLLALGAGAVTGLALGALGGGGSVLAAPALIYLLGFTPAAATTASLVVVTVTSATALVAHAREGAVRWRAGAVFAAAGIVPAAVGGAVSRLLPAALLTGAFAVLAGVAALRMLRPPAAGDGSTESTAAAAVTGSSGSTGAAGSSGSTGSTKATASAGATKATASAGSNKATASAGSNKATASAGSTRATVSEGSTRATGVTGAEGATGADGSADGPVPARVSRVAGAGAGLGAVTGVLGVGGGFLAVPSLVNVVGLRMRAAIGTSLLVITINSLTALAARAGAQAPVDWSAVGPFAAAAVLGAWDGKRLAARLSAGTLQRLFACALLAVAAFMLADAVF
ncbi:sulfite exporter TauE/SafE family protein [Streptomyces sp. NPDC007901]|uniref:sulfite exporter TauE/SafE family protein n=1 Tax=Streptomyces sp. NPDC007901 TaxID=3364785 RepID=UPI0036E1FA67